MTEDAPQKLMHLPADQVARAKALWPALQEKVPGLKALAPKVSGRKAVVLLLELALERFDQLQFGASPAAGALQPVAPAAKE